MLTRRQTLAGAVTTAAVAILGAPLAAAQSDGFVTITDNGEFITSALPEMYEVVEVRLKSGIVRLAQFDFHIMEVGDWDVLPVELGHDSPDIEAESIADQVVAWRRTQDVGLCV